MFWGFLINSWKSGSLLKKSGSLLCPWCGTLTLTCRWLVGPGWDEWPWPRVSSMEPKMTDFPPGPAWGRDVDVIDTRFEIPDDLLSGGYQLHSGAAKIHEWYTSWRPNHMPVSKQNFSLLFGYWNFLLPYLIPLCTSGYDDKSHKTSWQGTTFRVSIPLGEKPLTGAFSKCQYRETLLFHELLNCWTNSGIVNDLRH